MQSLAEVTELANLRTVELAKIMTIDELVDDMTNTAREAGRDEEMYPNGSMNWDRCMERLDIFKAELLTRVQS